MFVAVLIEFFISYSTKASTDSARHIRSLPSPTTNTSTTPDPAHSPASAAGSTPTANKTASADHPSTSPANRPTAPSPRGLNNEENLCQVTGQQVQATREETRAVEEQQQDDQLNLLMPPMEFLRQRVEQWLEGLPAAEEQEVIW